MAVAKAVSKVMDPDVAAPGNGQGFIRRHIRIDHDGATRLGKRNGYCDHFIHGIHITNHRICAIKHNNKKIIVL